MKKGDNKGLSTIVATLLIILLVLVAVGIIWVVIKNVISNSSEQISTGTFTISLEIVSASQPQDSSNNIINTNIKVKRNAGEGELEGLIFTIFDGTDTYTYKKTNVSLDQLETKTFVVDYTGKIVSISVYPILATSSGKETTGNLADTYYASGKEEYISDDCVPSCTGKECGDNGCGGNCGICDNSTPYCINGECNAESGLGENCSCAATTCIGSSCDNGIGGSCLGELQPNCGTLMCGNSPNGCDTCGTCEDGYYCNGGVCSPTCLISSCGTRECGAIPGRADCGTNFCGLCTATGETCNITSGTCEVCSPTCGTRECGVDPTCGTSCGVCNATLGETCNEAGGACFVCQPTCGTRECGVDPTCGTSCGSCDTLVGEYCNSTGYCVKDTFVNNGTVYSIWPKDAGAYFDSPDLPTSGVNYNSYWVNFPGSLEFDCLQIDEFVTPVMPEIYNMSYIKFVQTSSDIAERDTYEIWQTYSSCIVS